MVTQKKQDWHYVDAERRKQGPVSIGELGALAGRGAIRPETPVWSEGYESWIPASQIADLLCAAQQTQPPVLDPSSPYAAIGSVASDPAPAVEAKQALPGNAEGAPQAHAAGQELKPRKGSFLFPRMVTGVVLCAALAAGLAVVLIGLGPSPVFALLVFLLGVAFTSFAAMVAYRKERYELHGSHLVCHRGGLLSDQCTELEIRNITHVKLKLPWLRYKFFGVGDVIVESAGNSEPVVMRVVADPEQVYAGMRERMKDNGYDLTQQQLLHEERPAMIGVLGECAGMAFVSLMVLVFGLSTITGFIQEIQSAGVGWLLWILAPLFLLGAVAFLVVHFLDFRRRTYRVYNDVVVYEEGFLTRENAFIPYENIADAATKRSLFDQIFNLYDVLVSCQGTSSEIKFRRLQRGVELSNVIDQLVGRARQKPSPGDSTSPIGDPAAGALELPRRAEPELVAPGQAWVADLQMSAPRVLVPLVLLLPLFPLWIAAMIQAAIKLMSTRYAVRAGSIRHSYRFLTTHDREFACNKITGLVIKENLWDRLFGTLTLRFWSIGSAQSLDLAHVPRAHVDLEALMRQLGIPAASPQPCEVQASFGALTWLRARLNRLPLVLLVAAAFVFGASQSGVVFYWLLGALALGSLAGFGYAWAYYSRQGLRFHQHHVEAEQGVITRHRYYARYKNVKKTEATRYPGGTEGALQIFVAGEQQVQSAGERKGQAKLTRPCSFTSGFLPGIMDQAGLIDDILCGRVEAGPGATAAEPLELLHEAPRAVGNTLFKVIGLSVLVLPLVVLLPLTVPAAILAVKRWRYRLEAGRVVVSWGILYRRQASILLDRVDSLRQHQGPLNKLCKNGNVSIMTAGSSKPDLVMLNVPAYQVLYREIRKLSQGS